MAKNKFVIRFYREKKSNANGNGLRLIWIFLIDWNNSFSSFEYVCVKRNITARTHSYRYSCFYIFFSIYTTQRTTELIEFYFKCIWHWHRLYLCVCKWIDFQSICMNDYSAFIKRRRPRRHRRRRRTKAYKVSVWTEVGNIMHIN